MKIAKNHFLFFCFRVISVLVSIVMTALIVVLILILLTNGDSFGDKYDNFVFNVKCMAHLGKLTTEFSVSEKVQCGFNNVANHLEKDLKKWYN